MRLTAMKRLMAATAAAVSLGTAAAAQQTPPPPPAQMQARMKAARERAYKQLGVTAPQKQKLAAIEKKYLQMAMGKAQAFRKKYPNATPAQQQNLMNEVRAIGMKAQTESMAVLTPAQREKVKTMSAARGGGSAPR